MMSILEIKGLVKDFKNHRVLDHIDLKMESGKIYGLCGENGCGKTVLLKTICGFMKPSQGGILYDGQSMIEADPMFGIIFNGDGFFMDMSGFDNLQLLASIRNLIDNHRIREMIEKVGLDPNDKRSVRKYSLGMKQRLSIAQAFMEDNAILLLDEPMNALDEDGVKQIHQLIRDERDKGKLIILTSHNRYDIDSLCDVTFKIRNGKVTMHEKD